MDMKEEEGSKRKGRVMVTKGFSHQAARGRSLEKQNTCVSHLGAFRDAISGKSWE